MITQEDFQSLFPEAEILREEAVDHFGDLIYRVHFKFPNDAITLQFRITGLEQAFFTDSAKEISLGRVKKLVLDHLEREKVQTGE